MSAPEPTIFIIEDDEGVRGSLALLLSLEGFRTQVFGAAEEFLRTWRPGSAGCVVLDLRMPGMGGLELLAELRERDRAIPVIVITAHGDVQSTRASFKWGAVDFFEKPIDHTALLAAIRGAVAVDAERKRASADEARRDELLRRLTPRERDVFDRVAAGLHNREIAAELEISPRTVEVHKARIMEKLGVSRIPDLVRIAMQRAPKPPPRD